MVLRTTLLAATAVSLSAPALAQEQAAPGEEATATEGEIIVTARKREESLTDVPITISVIGAEAIERGHLVNISDIANQTPGFSYKQAFGRVGGGGGASVRPSIRGMSSVVGAPNAAFFVDGVFVSDNIASYQLDNVERVEIIKGPQSALFGRQTFSGAINYVTRRPSNEFTGRLKVTLAEYDNTEISGFISGPIVKDVLAFEVNARRYYFGGDYVNADNGRRELGEQKSTNFGGRLLFTPSPRFEAIASVGYSIDRDGGYVYGPQGSQLNNCFAPPLNGTVVSPIFGVVPRTDTARRGFFCGEIETKPSYTYHIDEIRAAGFDGLNREFLRTSLAMTFTGDSDWSVTSITAYNQNDSITGQDNSLVPTPNPSFSVDQSQSHDLSQEIRIQSPANRRIRALVGGYYYREKQDEGFQFTNTARTRRTFDSADGVRSKAVFGMIEGDVTDRLTLSAEARYQDETIFGSTEVLAPVGTDGAPPPAPIELRRAKFDAFLPRFTARYEISSDLTVFASAAKGNKPGGFNAFPLDAIPADLQLFRDQGFDVFEEEEAWSYEAGVKGSIVPGVNASFSAFYIDWTKQQLSRSESYTRANGTPNSVIFTQNAGKSEIKGFEAEVSGDATDWLFLRLGYTYVDAKFKEFYDDTTEEIFDTDGRPVFFRDGTRNPLDVDGPAGGDVSGNRLPQTPQHQIIATAQITLPAFDDFEFVGRSDFSYESKRYSQVDNLNHTGDSYNVNLTLGIENRNWSVNVFARNLLDDATPLVVTRILDFQRPISRINPLTGLRQTTFFRDFFVSAPRKRQFGVTASFKF
jgi:iron complex outermembrane recepter protein